MTDPQKTAPQDMAESEVLAGRRAVIIGGASGIGWGAAQRFVRAGARVVIADRDAQGARTRAEQLGRGAEWAEADVAEELTLERLFAKHDTVHSVLNCAGVNIPGRLIDYPLESWRTVLEVSLTGAFLVAKHAGRALADGGTLTSIASLNARQPAAGFGAYCAAKAGLTMLTEVAALELAPRGIRANAISPGLVETPLVTGLTSVPEIQAEFTDNTPLGRNGTVEDIAEVALFLASDASSWMTGEVLDVNGGAHLRRYPDVMAKLSR
ncbi:MULTISPECIES: SDR family NAD(P)-dependent oxidoreductase [Brevibacterium]|uniref:SDR family NAD(P)-dependent oxidoreductase n=1 Tax=Brevibacterium salitolerans TaxID=1403566 RepID=A0ABN2WID3_9MICO|nr:SDR family oxidoreductase [Brevibacterium sp.]